MKHNKQIPQATETTDATMQETIMQETAKTAKPGKKHWLKRLAWAILMPILLIFLGGLLLVLTGSDFTTSVTDTLSRVWLPLTLIRFAVYLILAYHIVPIFIRRADAKNNNKIMALRMYRQQSENGIDQQQLDGMIYQAQKQGEAYATYLSHRYWILIVLLLFDVFMIQIPYLIK